MPDCKFGYNFQTHHIIPIRKGGEDTFDNYIILCAWCHGRHKLHKLSEENRIALLVYKFMVEQDVLGFTTDEEEEEEIQKKLNLVVKEREKIDSAPVSA
ncbi:unnamed protein product [marine sediment metagenome]|uniref:HNH domain-containing protein n=1 Tax=marine sediment metagenome TaxID=412755 RepID=X1CAV6_9ZZZZ